MSKTIHIAALFNSLHVGGGVEKVQGTLSKGLVEKGYKFTHLLMKDIEPRNNYGGQIYSFDMDFVMGFGIKKILSLFILAYKVKDYCIKNNIDVLIGQGDFFYMVSGLSKILGNKSKTIAVVHTTIGIWHKKIVKILLFFLKKNDIIITISKEEKDIFIDNYNISKDKITHICNPIAIGEIYQKSMLPIDKQYEYLFKNKKYSYIGVGRLVEQKGFDRLLIAFDKINKEDKNTQLIIIGGGEQYEKLQELKNTLQAKKDIYLLGKQVNPLPFLKYANCFVLSSNFEGFGLVLIEAMICGLPIISTNCPTGPTEIIGGNLGKQEIEITKNGILVSYNINTEMNLYSGMKTIYNDKALAQSIGNNNIGKSKDFDSGYILGERDTLIQSLVH